MKDEHNFTLCVDIQKIIQSDSIPDKQTIEFWVKTALAEEAEQNKTIITDEQELTVRIVDQNEILNLNKTYRHKDNTTNVLSFPFESPPQIQLPLLGDIVICHDIVVLEARQQHKSLAAHWAHMIIHGLLHLKGYDHIHDTDAEIMETLEIHTLKKLGFTNPYLT